MDSYNPFTFSEDPFEESKDHKLEQSQNTDLYSVLKPIAIYGFLIILGIGIVSIFMRPLPEVIVVVESDGINKSTENIKTVDTETLIPENIVTTTTTTIPVPILPTTTVPKIVNNDGSKIVDNPSTFEILNPITYKDTIKKTVQVVAEKCARDIQYGQDATSLGTGVLISQDGYVVTNSHVIENCNGVIHIATINNVDETSEIKYFAKLIKQDNELDLALLKIYKTIQGDITKNNFNYFDMEKDTVSSKKLILGEQVEIWGYPTSRGNGTYSLNINLTKGTLSGFEKDAGYKRGWLVTDADISYGNSGGAALDSYGRLIGIPTFGVTEGASWIGYLRSVDVVMDWVGDLDSEEDNFTSFPILEIKEFNPLNIPKYNRDDWNSWTDDDGDCQNTRHEVLQLESFVNVLFSDSSKCYVKSGKWFDPYNGEFLYFASDLDIDHFIPLYNVHLSGGYKWSTSKKTEFANNLDDPDLLIAVRNTSNREKSASSPESWKPSNKAYWCEYALDWIRIKHQWDLSATQDEWDALLEMIDTCPNDINYETAVNYSHKFTDQKIRIYERNG